MSAKKSGRDVLATPRVAERPTSAGVRAESSVALPAVEVTRSGVRMPVALALLERISARVGPEWLRAWMWGGAIWIASRLAVMAAAYFGLLLGTIDAPDTNGYRAHIGAGGASWATFAHVMQQFDVNWYLAVATQGYASRQSSAFFPFYPLLIHTLHLVLPWLSLLGCAVLISNLALLIALALLVRLTEHELGKQAGQYSALLLLAYPAAFVFTIGYTESIYLALAVGTIYALRTGRWPIAGLLAAATVLTRLTGLALLPAFAWEYLRQSPVSWDEVRTRGLRWVRWRGHGDMLRILLVRLASVAAIPLALGAYATYLWWRLGSPLIFVKVEGLYWNHHKTLPTQGLVWALATLGQHPLASYLDARDLLDVIPILLFLGVLALGIRRLPLAYILYGFMVLLLVLSSPIPGSRPLQSGDRYVLAVFPVFMLLGYWGQRWPSLRALLLYSWLPLQGILLLHFVNGHGFI